MKQWLGPVLGPILAAAAALIVLAPSAFAQDLRTFENVTTVVEHVQVGNRVRNVLYLRPAHPTTTGRVPALILLEYLQGTPGNMADLTEAAALVRDQGIWVMLPESANGRWNFGPTSFSLADDVGFLSTVIDDAVARFPIDSHRVYMGGYSNGGHMTQRFACEQPGKIAAGAIISGSIHNVDVLFCRPGLGTPMVIFHGTEDRVIIYNGTPVFRSSPGTARLWAGFLGCAPVPVSSELPNIADDGTTVHLDRYANCSGGTPGLPGVDHYTINNGGHTWPGSFSFTSNLGPTGQDISATKILWQFVSQFSRP